MIYFTFGTKDVLEHECKNLDQKLELHMDGKKIDLPNIESIVVLNIACWGAGVRPWTLGAGKVLAIWKFKRGVRDARDRTVL